MDFDKLTSILVKFDHETLHVKFDVDRLRSRVLKTISLRSLSFLEFIKFVSQQEECRKKWLAAENEAVRLKQEIAKITVSFARFFKRKSSKLSISFWHLTSIISFLSRLVFFGLEIIIFYDEFLSKFSSRLRTKHLK